MPTPHQAAAVRGKTIRLTWTEGPTKGMSHEHLFHADGTVEWYDAKKGRGASPTEKPEYAAIEVARNVVAVSYLASTSGYTLTVVLNFEDHGVVGFASSAKDWHPVRGTFEVVR
jgi:hypothetical protein